MVGNNYGSKTEIEVGFNVIKVIIKFLLCRLYFSIVAQFEITAFISLRRQCPDHILVDLCLKISM